MLAQPVQPAIERVDEGIGPGLLPGGRFPRLNQLLQGVQKLLSLGVGLERLDEFLELLRGRCLLCEGRRARDRRQEDNGAREAQQPPKIVDHRAPTVLGIAEVR